MQVRVGLAEATMLISPHCFCQGVQQQAEGQSLETSLHSKAAGNIGFWLQSYLSLIMQTGGIYPTKDQSDLKFISW